MNKVKKTIVFGEGTDLKQMINSLAKLNIIEDLRGYPDYEIVETATGKTVMKAPSVSGKAYPVTWIVLSKIFGLESLDRPEYENYLFAFEAE